MHYSYCGDRFPNTIITEENQLGLTFETSLRNSAKGFSARVTLLNGMLSKSSKFLKPNPNKNCKNALCHERTLKYIY